MVTLFLIGVLCAAILDELTGITPGGYVVPGYLALVATDWRQLLATLVLTLVVMTVVKGLERVTLLYGRRRLAYAIATGATLKLALLAAAPLLGALPSAALIVGYVVPGIVADRCLRQGFWKTISATTACASIAWLLGRAVIG